MMINKTLLLFKKDKKLIKKAGIALLVIAALIFSFFIDKAHDHDVVLVDSRENEMKDNTTYEEEDKSIVVDISGAVKNPGIVVTFEGKRLYEVFDEVGGLREDACLDSVNQAAFLQDQQKIYIPTKEESKSPGLYTYEMQSGNTKSLININTGSSEDLQKLKGVGPVTAEKIIDFRTKNGPFKKIEQLMDVSGIGQKTFDSLKDSITI